MDQSFAASLAPGAMKISRRMANEVGMTSEQLLQLMTCSPSPRKKMVDKSLIVAQETQPKVSSMRSEKENISGINRFLEEEFPLPNQQKKGSKDTETTFSMKDGGSVYVPRLQLKKLDQNVTAKESLPSNLSYKCPSLRSHKSSSSTSSGTPNSSVGKSSHNTKRRWKVCILLVFFVTRTV